MCKQFLNFFSFATISLALSPLAAQSSETIGGWNVPIIQGQGFYYLANIQLVADCTGDGVRDLLLGDSNFGPYRVLDGATGSTWLETNPSIGSYAEIDFADFDGDGIHDLLVRYPNYSSPSHNSCGRIDLIRGGTGISIWSAIGVSDYQYLGVRIELEDVNFDRIPDVIGFYPSTACQMIDGQTGQTLWTANPLLEYGLHFSADANADGVRDLVIVESTLMSCLNSVDGTILWTTATPFVSNTGNQDDPSAIHFIDLDGNGSTEILLAEDGYSSISNEPRRGGVFAVDAGSGSQLWLAEGSGTYHSFGSDLRFFDANSDGTLDCMNADRKAVELVDGQTGSNVWVMNTFQFMDSSQASVLEDLTGDGVPDYVGINDTSSDTLFAIDGQSGSLLWRIDGDAAIGSYVRNVQAVNVDGLGTTEIVFTSPVGAGGRGFVTAVDGPSGQPLWTVVGSHRQFGFGYDTHIHATGPGNPVQVITKDFMPFRNELISVDGATGSVMWRKALPASLDGYWISADLNGDGTNEIIEIDEQLDLGIAIFDPATGAILKSVQNFLGDAFKWGGFHDDLDGDGWMDLLFLGGRYYPNTPKVISSKQDDYASCLNLSSNNISQANGGSISVGLEFPLEFANSSYRLLLSTKQGVESYGGALVPLMPSMLFNRTKMGDYLGLSFTGAIGNLSLMADGTIIWRVAPNELPVAAVGQTFSMAVVLEITNGNFGLFSSGHKAITITP